MITTRHVILERWYKTEAHEPNAKEMTFVFGAAGFLMDHAAKQINVVMMSASMERRNIPSNGIDNPHIALLVKIQTHPPEEAETFARNWVTLTPGWAARRMNTAGVATMIVPTAGIPWKTEEDKQEG
jgi:hypothetical protein